MKKGYGYRLTKDRSWRTGYDSIAEALADAQERYPEVATVYVAETRKYIPSVASYSVIEDLQQDVYDVGWEGEFLDSISRTDEAALDDILTAAFVKWAKERGITYCVDIAQDETKRIYTLKTGRRMDK